jgi:hypothetical protein
MVTWAQLGWGALLIAGVVMAALGALMWFAASMRSSVTTEGDNTAGCGCTMALAGLAMLGMAGWYALQWFGAA